MDSLNRPGQILAIQQIDRLYAEIDALRPLSNEQEARILQKFRLDWNYHSNAIEGNSLDYGETVAFLLYGITAKGKPFKDYLDIQGHNQAIDFLLELIRDNADLTETDIRNLHKLVLGEPYQVAAQTPDGAPTTKRIVPGQYKTSANHVQTQTGLIHYYATPEETPARMQELMVWYRANEPDPTVHPVVLAALTHHRFVAIHPFDDGNGRMTRLLTNLILMRAHYPPVVIKQQDRGTYYLTLSQADAGNLQPSIEFMAENVLAALTLYLKGARGESLEEPSDLDKELALFKVELRGKEVVAKVAGSIEMQQAAFIKSFLPLVANARLLMNKFQDLFTNSKEVPYVLGEIKFGLSSVPDGLPEMALLEGIPNGLVRLGLSFEFSEFSTNREIGLRVILGFLRRIYNYQIAFQVSDPNRTVDFTVLTEKPYTEFLQPDEVTAISNRIGHEILAYLKQATNSDTAV